MISFVSNGFNILSASSRRQYSERTAEIQNLRVEMLDKNFASFHSDRENLIRDKRSVAGDVGRAFIRISSKNSK